MNKALFLDRDGIVNIDKGYVHNIADIEFVEGIFALCKKAYQQGYKIIMVTNQSGIGRGYYSEDDFTALTEWIHAAFAQKGIEVSATYFCPHHPTKGKGKYLTSCECRKPAPGMLIQAKEQNNIDFLQSIYIGDKDSDMEAAQKVGIEKRYLLRTNYPLANPFQDTIVESLHDIPL
ncbi:D-glycero-beta-D-manno-heptose 1,7-bisphosphate 7-phosphatase [Thalassotalea agarivorans]|uniref:D,D-heptose 1,7-bisphosphate phosphatase n=1 Tax=Thalassotalea agarivorans TaxID=349064 RepID=A0A1I0HZ56_THASX|nr:D-glycero-beta-D-manno-heptose 1,7-bisphosphate 7-phosphatase [Thalassotalea agarivorans]SET89417.1 D-glycero-D-manno-heptose 1,7-bisphosphate phosphatase [Thalassotalea agarivorans]